MFLFLSLSTLPLTFPCSFFSLLTFFRYLPHYLLSSTPCFHLPLSPQPSPLLSGSSLCSQVPGGRAGCQADPGHPGRDPRPGAQGDALHPNAEGRRLDSDAPGHDRGPEPAVAGALPESPGIAPLEMASFSLGPREVSPESCPVPLLPIDSLSRRFSGGCSGGGGSVLCSQDALSCHHLVLHLIPWEVGRALVDVAGDALPPLDSAGA